MIPEELEDWAEDFEAFHARFAHLFARREPREQALADLRADLDEKFKVMEAFLCQIEG